MLELRRARLGLLELELSVVERLLEVSHLLLEAPERRIVRSDLLGRFGIAGPGRKHERPAALSHVGQRRVRLAELEGRMNPDHLSDRYQAARPPTHALGGRLSALIEVFYRRSFQASEEARALAARIKKVRERRKLSQKAFADLVGASPSYVSEVEAGKSKPSVDMVFGVATHCPGIDLRWLLTGNGDIIPTGATLPSANYNLWEIAIMRAVRRATEAGGEIAWEQTIAVFALQFYIETAQIYNSMIEHGLASHDEVIEKMWRIYDLKGKQARIGSR
jgi:transcriptional regulator with XRE-family HTH domain